MTSTRWEQIKEIFDAALEQPESSRDVFVSSACKGDGELEAALRDLLAAHGRAGSFLEKPAPAPASLQQPLTHANHTLSEGSVVSQRFRILRFVGEGGMGQVYEALDTELDCRVALKTIRPDISADQRVLSRFKQEVQLTRRITHPNVCRMFDIQRHVPADPDDTSSGFTFLTMEFLAGETLADMLGHRRRLSTAEAMPLALQMIEALSAAHDAGIVHRDFKPGNVMLVPTNSAVRVVVTDFGLARAVLPDGQTSAAQVARTMTGNAGPIGTLVYMAPEQLERGEATPASDIYSLGLVMYEMVTGQRPFADPIPFAEAVKRLKQPVPSAATLVPHIDPTWDAAISRCLTLEAKDRFPKVCELAEALAAPVAAVGTSVATTEANTGTSLWARPIASRRKYFAAAAFVVLLVSLSALAFRHYWMKAEEARLAEGSTVLLTDIQNSTGDARFDSTTEIVRSQLLQSPYFSLMDSDKIHKTLGEMLKPDNTSLVPQTAREVAMRNGVRRVVFGAVSRVGDSYVLDLDIEQPDNSPLRFRQHWQNHWTWNMSGSTNGDSAKDMPGGFLDAIRDSSDWIRHEIGESANDIAREDAPPEDVTTANWQALSEFTQATQFGATGQRDSAIKALQNAVAADPNFALAYARLGDILVSVSRFTEGYAAYSKALALGDQRLTRRERDRIRGIYANDAWDYATAEAMFRDYATYYPNDYLGWFYRATPLMMMGRVEEAIETLKKAEAIDPAKMYAPAHIARFDLILGKYDDATKWIKHLRDTGHSDDADLVEGESDFLKGLFQDSHNCFTRLTTSHNPLYVSYGYSLLTRLYAEQGRDKEALGEIGKGLAADRSTGDVVHEADKILDRAYIECRMGQHKSCLQDTKASLHLDHGLQRALSAATLLGQAAAESSSATKMQITLLLRQIDLHLPNGEFIPFSNIVRAHLRGEVLLSEGKWTPALAEFRKANQLEPSVTDKVYLARGLLAQARHTTDLLYSRQLKSEAAEAYKVLGSKPGLVWQWAQNYFPGFTSDSNRTDVNFEDKYDQGEIK